jgi:hypothetical protein
MANGGREAITAACGVTPWSGTYAPGHLTAGVITGGTPASLQAALIRQYSHYRAADWIQLMRTLWDRQVVSPTLQSALLTILAGQPDVSVQGTTTDRDGRPGVAVSAIHTGAPDTREVVIFDQKTGMLLDEEDIALQAGSLPIKAPATIGYTVWLTRGYTTTTTERP